MATVIVNSSVWNRIHEYYDNVEIKYPNTWNINDTIAQISKIQWVISNFENVCFWSRESIILYWKRMGWKETWHKSSPWHFAFEYKRVNEQDYIFIQDAEHQDDIKESSFNLKSKIIENKLYNTMKNTRNKVRLTESQLHNVIMESVKQVLTELDWKTYANAAKKAYEKGRDSGWDFSRAAERELNKKYPHSSHHVSPSDEREFQRFDRNLDWTAWRPMDGHEESWPAWVEHGSNHKYDPKAGVIITTPKDDEKEIGDFIKGNYEYEPNGRGWYLKDNMDESIRRAIRKVLH